MSCIPFLYGVGAGVAMIRGYWPPPQIPPVACPPPQPQQPPLQPPSPPPGPPPSQVYVETSYSLSFPPFVGVNVKVFWDDLDDYILPSPTPIALQWQYYPRPYISPGNPRILATTINPNIATALRPFIDDFGFVHVDIDGSPYGDYYKRYSYFLVVWQFLFYEQRWIVVVHEVDLPYGLYSGWTWQGGATPKDYRLALQNRKERLVLFYDSALQGLGSFTHRDSTIYLTPTAAFIGYINNPDDPDYYIQPTDSPAYCMYTEVWWEYIQP